MLTDSITYLRGTVALADDYFETMLQKKGCKTIHAG